MSKGEKSSIVIRPHSRTFQVAEKRQTLGGEGPPELRYLARLEVFFDMVDGVRPDYVELQGCPMRSALTSQREIPTVTWSWDQFKRVMHAVSLWANANIGNIDFPNVRVPEDPGIPTPYRYSFHPPNEPGWWWRKHKTDIGRVVLVQMAGNNKGFVYWTGSMAEPWIPVCEAVDVQWAGPIVRPQDCVD